MADDGPASCVALALIAGWIGGQLSLRWRSVSAIGFPSLVGYSISRVRRRAGTVAMIAPLEAMGDNP